MNRIGVAYVVAGCAVCAGCSISLDEDTGRALYAGFVVSSLERAIEAHGEVAVILGPSWVEEGMSASEPGSTEWRYWAAACDAADPEGFVVVHSPEAEEELDAAAFVASGGIPVFSLIDRLDPPVSAVFLFIIEADDMERAVGLAAVSGWAPERGNPFCLVRVGSASASEAEARSRWPANWE